LTFWRDGFSINDGPLMRYDAPGNKELLEMIQAGAAPPTLFGLKFGQALQLEVTQRTQEEYQPPPKGPTKAFGGEGNRLGSPAPAVSGAGSGRSSPSIPGGYTGGGGSVTASASASASASFASQSVAAPAAAFAVDESKPTTSVQVRLYDGTRLVVRVNLDHTVHELRNFVQASRADMASRAFILQTTFPPKELADPEQTIEGAGLKNAVVVQRLV